MTTLNKTRGSFQFPDISLNGSNRLVFLAFLFGVLQFVARLACMGRYGFHQDELLYMALGDHLAWGFKETPPFIAVAGRLVKFLFGDSIFAMRALPSICAALVVFFAGKITIKLGGRTFAVVLACSGVAFSSAFLATGALFIPQVFDELGWTIVVYLLVSWYKSKKDVYLILLGLVGGIAILVKYTIFMYGMGLIAGMLCTSEGRIIFKRRAFWLALLLAFTIWLPNLLWQISNGFPAISHFSELRETQLVYISSKDFIIQQLFANGSGIVIWLAGLYILFTDATFKAYRFIAIAFIFVTGVLMLLSGKSYYAFGAYPALFAAGGIFFERCMRKISNWKKTTFYGALLVPNLVLMLIVLPYLPIEKTARVFEWTYTHLHIHFPLKWEDQKIHNMNQNYADMIGWDELALKAAKLYHSLPESERKNTVIVADNYGEAGAIDYYQERYGLPKLISLSSSYATWAPPTFTAKNMIYIIDSMHVSHSTGEVTKRAEVVNPYSRVKGLDIYLVQNVRGNFRARYRKAWLQKQNGQPLRKLLAFNDAF